MSPGRSRVSGPSEAGKDSKNDEIELTLTGDQQLTLTVPLSRQRQFRKLVEKFKNRGAQSLTTLELVILHNILLKVRVNGNLMLGFIEEAANEISRRAEPKRSVKKKKSSAS